MIPKFLITLILFTALAGSAPSSGQAQWVQTNGPYGGGQINALAVNGSDIFAGTAEGGVYHSSDGGIIWKESGLIGYNITAVAVQGQNVYAAAGYIPYGLFMSTDYGKSWYPANNGLTDSIVAALIVYGTKIFAGTANGIFASSDSGKTWVPSDNGIEYPEDCYSFASDGTNLYAGADGIFRSTNSGSSWEKIDNFSTYYPGFYSLTKYGNILLAGTSDGILRTSNEGTTWTTSDSLPYVVAFVEVGNAILAASEFTFPYRIIVSHDSGAHWVAMPSTSFVGERIVLASSKNGDVFAGSDGIFRSTDTGISWEPRDSGIINGWTSSLASMNQNIFAASHGIILKTTDQGNSWIHMDSGIYIYSLLAIGDILLASSNVGVIRSTDEGITWTYPPNDAFSGPSGNSSIITSNGSTVYAASYFDSIAVTHGEWFFYKSLDSGATWKTLGYFNIGGVSSILAIGDNLIVGTNKGILYSFARDSTPGLINQEIFSLGTIGTKVFASDSNGLFESIDSGKTWDLIDSGSLARGIVTLMPYDKYLFACGNGVLLSLDSGKNWISVNDSLPSVSSLAFDEQKNVYAGALGVWRRPLSEMIGQNAVAETPVSKQEICSYPNPFSQSTHITFTTEAAGYADVTIVNLLGVEVARLFSGMLDAGEHNFAWSTTSGLPDGVYECLVRLNGQIEKLSMVLMR
jgi:photosystem II stability/assembly factor-like uncharacterized protein